MKNCLKLCERARNKFGRGYSQVDYLDIKSTSQRDYLDIKSTSQVDYLDIKSTSQVDYLDIKSMSQIHYLDIKVHRRYYLSGNSYTSHHLRKDRRCPTFDRIHLHIGCSGPEPLGQY